MTALTLQALAIIIIPLAAPIDQFLHAELLDAIQHFHGHDWVSILN